MKAPLAQLTKAKILTLYKWRCKHGHNGIAHYNCWVREAEVPERVGFLDIEASNLKANFGIMLSWCIKPAGKATHFDCITPTDLTSSLDKRIVSSCIQEMNQYDRLVGHYSSRYDFPFIRTRALQLGLKFPPHGQIVQTDVWRLARNNLCLHSNRQDVVAEALQGKTVKTRLDSNHWIKALMGDAKALEYILDHNKKDVLDLEKNYNVLVGFSPRSGSSV